ncbi:MAG: hypothetical protein LAQ69_00475 [Acidobacteriia bacterium]|nr:hypothetical protein [Terriglobia bacterium]
MLLCIGFIVPIRIYSLVRYTWNLPLRSGPGFFLGVEVPAGFYDAPEASWLRRYHTVLLGEHLIEACVLTILLALAQWQAIPLWAGGSAVLFVGTLMTFVAWTRHSLAADPPVRAVALALETRRLGDYISWPLEALAALLVTFSWWLLLHHGGTPIDWLNPLQNTWIALGLLPGKIAMVRSGSPLPLDRTEEHYQCQDVARRNRVQQMNAFGWFFVVILFGYALWHGWPSARTVPGLPWLFMGVALAIMGYLMIVVFRGERQMARMGRDLRPSSSWSTPFRRATFMSRPGLIWFSVWFGGILVLVLYSLL